jgi:predicted dehydrogenase
MPYVALVGVSVYAALIFEIALTLHREGVLCLVAAVVINPAQESAKCEQLRALGCEIHATLESLLRAHASRLDLVVIPTPIHLHRTMTCAALAAGVNVLVEKPLAPGERDIDEIEESARAAGRLVGVGFQDLYADTAHELKTELVDGAIGQIRRIRGRACWPRTDAYYNRNQWAGKWQVYGQAVMDRRCWTHRSITPSRTSSR